MVLDHGMDDALRVDHDLDRLARRAEEPERLDHLEALVHHRGESTEILRPITQLGCAQASSGVTPASRSIGVERRGARGREEDPAHAGPGGLARAPADEAARQRLEDRRMLAVDGQQHPAALGQGGEEERAGDHERFLVGEQHELSRPRSGERARQARRAHHRGHHRIGLGKRGDPLERARPGEHLRGDSPGPERGPQALRGRLVRHRRPARLEALALRRELVVARAGRERQDLEALRVARHDVERALADRSRGAENGQPLHASESSSAAAGGRG